MKYMALKSIDICNLINMGQSLIMKENKLSLKVVIPFILSIILIVLVAMASTYAFQTRHINELSVKEFENVSKILTQTIKRDTELLQGLSELIQKDKNVINLYEAKNRDWLFTYLYQTYLNTNSRYNVTHLYIHDKNKTNFVRIHDRNIYSDVIHRYTLDKTAETSKVTSGIEFSMSQNYTLRVVSPLYDAGEIIGYIELGKEIDKITNELSNTLGTHIFLTINKNVMEKNDYEKWKKENSNNLKYTELENYYIANSTIFEISLQKELLEVLNSHTNVDNQRVQNNALIYNINSKPFYDVTGKEIGKLYVLANVTDEMKELKFTIIQTSIILMIVILLILFFHYRYINKIDIKMKNYMNSIEFNYQFERYVNNISKYLVYDDDIGISINKTLQELGTILNAHRAYLFSFKDNYSIMNNTHEWCSVGTEPEINNLQEISTENFSWWVLQCKALEPIVIEDMNTLPEEASDIKFMLMEQHIQSLLVYPVVLKKEVIGFIGIDMVHHQQKWSETHHSFIKITAESIANALEKQEYEQEIIDASTNMSLTLNTASNGILAIDKNNKISFYNKKLLQIWELDTLDENIDTLKKIFELVSPQFFNYATCLSYFNHFNENREKEQVYMFYLKNNRVVEITAAPSFDKSVFKGNSISFRDVTQKVLLEKELQLSSKVFENSLEGIIITDADTTIIKVNDSFSKITGYSREELIGSKPSLLESHWHDKEFYDGMWKHLQENSVWEGEVKDRRKDGELYISLSTLIMIKDIDGNTSNYIGINRDVTDLKKAEDHVKALAYYDSLTNLPNRTLFYDRLEQNTKYCERNEGKMALLFIDLDNFKAVNDTYGHHIGDLLLQKVAILLTDSVRGSDTVSRLGGDEFTIILRKIDSRDNVTSIANKIITQLLEPVIVNDIPLNIGSSIGAAIFPDDTHDKSVLLKMADTAMYNAKNGGKNCLKFFEVDF
jgi:diguanylate cyclase (GGDEF)-like protein/PAS domain S-box-containing protein